jgi:dolichyl-phosphate-mannose-protein mannosyltransferase
MIFLTRHRNRILLDSLIAWIAFSVVIIFLMIHTGAFHTEFVDAPDEAGHFINGLFVHDYFTHSKGIHPLEFAQQYYGFYPKIAIGHWPPAFYFIQAVWYGIFGIGSIQAMSLQALIFILSIWLLFLCTRVTVGGLTAFIICLIVILSPIVQYSVTKFLADGIVGLLMFATLIQLSFYLSTRRSDHLIYFIIFALISSLTKVNALSFIFIIPIAVIISGHIAWFRSKTPWIIGFILALVILLWYIPTSRMMTDGMVSDSLSFHRMLSDLKSYLWATIISIGPLASLFCIIGIFSTARIKRQTKILSRVSLGYVIGWLLFHVIVPTGGTHRFIVSFLIPICILVCEGIRWTTNKYSNHFIFKTEVLALACLICFLLTSFTPPTFTSRGYSEALDLIPKKKNQQVILIVSDSSGEGALVVRSRLEYPLWHTVNLRASKVLSESDWLGDNYKTLFNEVSALRNFLEKTTVDYVILDSFGDYISHYDQIDQLVQSDPKSFLLIGEQLIIRKNKCGKLRIYETRFSKADRNVTIRFNASSGRIPIEITINK